MCITVEQKNNGIKSILTLGTTQTHHCSMLQFILQNEITNKPVITSSQVTKSNNTYTFNVNSNTTNKTLNLTATNADSAKIFIWDSLKNMIPLCNAVTKNL